VLELHGAFAFVYAKEKYVLDWKTDLPYVDLDKPWWDKDFAGNLAIAGKLFAMTGDISHNSIGATFCMIFNKDLFDQYLIEYPYQTVIDGKWTFDRFAEIVKTASVDLNGDSKMTPEADLYGFTIAVP
jgi:ABC-type glycerol-3-phosphate transport system substrate-binding protein